MKDLREHDPFLVHSPGVSPDMRLLPTCGQVQGGLPYCRGCREPWASSGGHAAQT